MHNIELVEHFGVLKLVKPKRSVPQTMAISHDLGPVLALKIRV